MCGISGIVALNSKRFETNIDKMNKSLSNRGPDTNGKLIYGDCILGHTRLSIIDLINGHQPMDNKEDKIAVTFNGEIYGYRELRNNIRSYPFKTISDTEVILALYRQYGFKMVNKLPGMFAFAIWDDKKKVLFCVRDRFGEKPFYYSWGNNGEFVFSSEIKGILASGLIEPVIDRGAVINYLKHSYIHPNRTVYKNIYTLMPSHKMVIKNHKVLVNKYWNLPKKNLQISSMNEAKEEFQRLFNQSIKRQLVTDVPFGVFLSGGLDSSIIVAEASKFEDKIKTISFKIGGLLNETKYSYEMARMYDTDHIVIDLNNHSIPNVIEELQYVFDEPFADSSNVPTYLMAKATKGMVKVVLGGDGGDELLAGYNNWYNHLINIKHHFNSSPNYSKLSFYKNTKNIVSNSFLRDSVINKILNRYSYLGHSSISNYYYKKKQVFNNNDLKLLGLKDFDNGDFEYYKGLNDVNEAMKTDLINYLPGDLLVKTDRATMANSIELRSPFLDTEFASFCASLPIEYKIDFPNNKKILKESYKNQLPESIIQRNKQGFGAPVKEWFQDGLLDGLVYEYISNKQRKIYTDIGIKYNNAQNIMGEMNQKSWTLLILSIWCESKSFNS